MLPSALSVRGRMRWNLAQCAAACLALGVHLARLTGAGLTGSGLTGAGLTGAGLTGTGFS